ncbi:fumarylacetoacetate hydrolase family protein [Martelella mediterranea]|uniref:fumarylacetoacetate hydrolase family protein n=1 Tax=Martelella mediterranea TaxID=293089 RepID=UPI001E3D5A38|nr:fumarylacetoacetate hydrolase family protein [Martelella mediterranea]MCD1634722.1 fumarylacetoacetate hydrolase family protein [Martelella mediterranea]
MRVASFILPEGTASYGVVEGDTIRDAGAGLRAKYPDLKAVIAADAIGELRSADGESLATDSVSFIPTIQNPDKIICIGLNYLGHIKETGRDRPEYPSIFTRYPSTVVGHDQPMIRPKASDKFDYEGEFAVVIGKRGRAIAKDKAFDHVAGYTGFNDGSIRDYQRHTTQFWGGKNFDRSGSMGPWIVTPDELGDVDSQTLVTRLNGEVMQETSIGDLAFKVPDLIAYVSTITELLPGDIIATGTPSGVGFFRDPKVFMKAGDRIEVEISGIGTLRNTIADE